MSKSRGNFFYRHFSSRQNPFVQATMSIETDQHLLEDPKDIPQPLYVFALINYWQAMSNLKQCVHAAMVTGTPRKQALFELICSSF
jgi:hypothetical protein